MKGLMVFQTLFHIGASFGYSKVSASDIMQLLLDPKLIGGEEVLLVWHQLLE